MQCNCCFNDYLAKCETEVVVNAGLTPLAAYRWVITDKFGNKHEGAVTADGDGAITIPVADLPAGLLTQYSGEFTLQIYDSTCKPIKFKMTNEYDCVSFDVVGGNFVKNNLGCVNTCIGAGGSNVLIPFTDAATVSIDYSAYIDSLGNNPLIQVYHETSPGVYQLVDVAIEQIRSNGTLTDIEVDNGGVQTGYVLIS